MKAEKKPPIAAAAAALLLCLVLISVHMTSGIFARYSVTADIPDADVHAAGFSVSAQADTQRPVFIIADGTDENGIAAYTVKLMNNSEVAVRYDAVVNFSDGDKAKFSDADGLTFSGYIDSNGVDEKQLTFDMSGYFEQNDRYDTFRNDDISGSKGKCPFEVAVKFTQAD